MLSRARRYLTDAAGAFERAPVEVVLVVLLALGCSWAIEANDQALRIWLRLATAGSIAFAGAWSATLLHALGRVSQNERLTITAASLVAAALLATFTLDFDQRAENWRALLLVGAAVSWLLAVPAFALKPEQRNLMLRRVNGRISIRALGAALYALALFLGLSLALRAVDTLFELTLDDNIYAHVFAWLMLVLVPWVTLGGLPDYVRPIDEVSQVTTVVHRLTRFLVPPLLALYYVILYAYAVRIALVGELPKNLVSPMVIAAGLLAAAALLLFDPERADRSQNEPPGGRGVLGVLRLAPPFFLPLAVLGFWSLWPRIAQYGWTEFRATRFALLIALTLLAVGGTVLLVQRKRFPLRPIGLTLAIVLVLSALGPFSVLAMSKRSQQQRLTATLSALGLPGSAATTSRRVMPAATYDQINSSAQFLYYHFGASALPASLPASARTDSVIADLAGHFGLTREVPVGQRESFAGTVAANARLQLGNERTALRIVYPPGNVDRSGVAESVSIRPDSAGLLHISIAQETLTAAIRPVIDGLSSAPGQSSLPPQHGVVPVTDATGTRRGTLIVFSIVGERGNGLVQLSHLDGLLLLDPRSP